jgi:hypothetical protein
MSKGGIYENKHDPLEYNIIEGIKIYTGTTAYSSKQLNSNISYYRDLLPCGSKIFTELIPSTLTAKGKFNNICFNEEEIIDMLTTPVGGYILKIGCNYGVIVNPSPDYTPPPVKVRISNRGRKPKAKPKSKRKLQGTGKFFSSQITFEIYNVANNKIYKIKLFRNGGFQVPGVNKPDMSDLIAPIKILREYLRDEFMDNTIDIQYFISVMRNYICRISNTNMLIRLNELETLLKGLKEMENVEPIIDLVDVLYKKHDMLCPDIIKDYIGQKNNMVGMAEIQNNCERYFGLILKFYRPVPWKMSKRTTIKVLRSGKINIDGGNSIEESLELYHWIESMFGDYASTILYNPTDIGESSDDYDIGSGESVYDDELGSIVDVIPESRGDTIEQTSI